MSKSPLKFNPEDVMIVKIDMNQDQFDFAMEVAKSCLDKFGARDEPGMSQHMCEKFNAKYGVHWVCVVGSDFGFDVGHKGHYAHFQMNQRYKDKPRQEKYFVIYKVA